MMLAPMNSKLYPWQVAVLRRAWVTWATLPAIWTEAYLKTFYEVWRG